LRSPAAHFYGKRVFQPTGITSGFFSSEHNLMEASTHRCPGGEPIRRYGPVTVCSGVCL